jgi:hypothetical protein
MMAILNYTTEVSTARTVGQIQEILAKAGANQILAAYESGRVVALSFSIETALGEQVYRLPADPGRVLAVLKRQRVAGRYATLEHAERVAWRIVKAWIEAQLAIIQTEMVTLDQVMLPYMRQADGSTVYQHYLEQQGHRALTEVDHG